MLFQYTSLSPSSLRLLTFQPHTTATHLSLSLHHQPEYPSSYPSTPFAALLWRSPSDPTQGETDEKEDEERTSITLSGRSLLIPRTLSEVLAALWRHLSSSPAPPSPSSSSSSFPHTSTSSPSTSPTSLKQDGNTRWDILTPTTPFFVEELCVNPRDSRERTRFAAERSAIFAAAGAVVVWMGAENDVGKGWWGGEEGGRMGITGLRDVLVKGNGVWDEEVMARARMVGLFSAKMWKFVEIVREDEDDYEDGERGLARKGGTAGGETGRL